MSDQQSSSSIQNMMIQLEVVAEDEQRTNIAEVDEIGRGIFDYFRESGYTIKPTYTGRMGAGPIYDIIIHAYHLIHDNQELLTAMFTSVTAALTLISAHTKQDKKEKTRHVASSIEIAFPMKDNNPLVVKAPDAETAIHLLKQLPRTHIEEVKNIIPQKSVNLKVSVSRKKRERLHQ